jgi:hypothetical protein
MEYPMDPKRGSAAEFIASELRDGIVEWHGHAGPCDGHHSTLAVGYVDFMLSVKPGRPATLAQRRASYREAARVCWASQCRAYRIAGDTLATMAAELASPRR